MQRTLILGVGNLILSDDGVGIHAVRLLQEKVKVNDTIMVVEGGTCGLDLLQYRVGLDRLIVLDAAKPDHSPGKITRITGEKVPAYLSIKTSPHEIGLPELLFAAKLSDIYPKEVIIYCVEALSLETGIELSPIVEKQVENLILQVRDEVGL
jgi:hydrogenase maturation protease